MGLRVGFCQTLNIQTRIGLRFSSLESQGAHLPGLSPTSTRHQRGGCVGAAKALVRVIARLASCSVFHLIWTLGRSSSYLLGSVILVFGLNAA